MQDPEPPRKERLQKILARAGFGSRRACEELIVSGRVAVNGQTVSVLGAQADPASDRVTVDGERVKLERTSYWVLNKPPGVAFTDETMSEVVADYIPGESARLFTVGRLDRASGGLVLLTNDGRVANLLTHPRYKVPRVYRIEVSGEITTRKTALIERALFYAMNGGKFERISILKPARRGSVLRLTAYEGLPDSLRDIFLKFDHPVQAIERVKIGALELGDLAPGQSRKLRPHELDALMDYAARAEKLELDYLGNVVSPEHFGKLARTPDFHRKHKGHRGPSPGGQKRFAARARGQRDFGQRRPFDGERKPRSDRERQPFDGERKPRFDRERRPFDGERKPRFDREHRPFDSERKPRFDRERRPFDGERKPRFDRERRPFDGERKPRFDRERRPFDGERKPRFDRERRPFDGERKPRFDRERRPFDGERKPRFDRERRPFDPDRPRGPRGPRAGGPPRRPFGPRRKPRAE